MGDQIDAAAVDSGSSGDPWWVGITKDVVNGAIGYNTSKLQIQNKQMYGTDAYGNLVPFGSYNNVSTRVGTPNNQAVLLIGLAAVGLLILLAVRK